MTILQALQSLTEYDNSTLFSKVLADNNLNPDEEYSSVIHKDKLDCARADLYDAMSVLPEFKDGNSSTSWNSSTLKSEARSIRRRLGVRKGTITGKLIW